MGTPEPQKTKRYRQEFKLQAVAMSPSVVSPLRVVHGVVLACCKATSGVNHEQSACLQIK